LILGFVLGAAFGFLMGLPLALGLGTAFRASKGAELQEQMEGLTPLQRAEVLASFRHDHTDAGRLADRLSRAFGMPTELTPAAAPTSRGDEASPAEEAP
jgi:hypothetical protein